MSDRLHIYENPELLKAIYTSDGDKAWRQAMIILSYELAQQGARQFGASPETIVAIPRGGRLVGTGAQQQFPNATLLHSNAGANKDESKPLLSQLNGWVGETILGDGIIASGKSVAEHVRELTKVGVDPADILVFAPIVTEVGVHAIHAIDERISVVTAHVEEEGCWVRFTENGPVIADENDFEAVYVIGPVETDEDGNVLSMDLGDFGDMTEQVTNL